jgi:hypothetical protein
MTPDEVAVLAGESNPQDYKTSGSESSEKFSVEQFTRGLIAKEKVFANSNLSQQTLACTDDGESGQDPQ